MIPSILFALGLMENLHGEVSPLVENGRQGPTMKIFRDARVNRSVYQACIDKPKKRSSQ
jgi:hypothetical protein